MAKNNKPQRSVHHTPNPGPRIVAKFQAALDHHQHGRIDAAEALYHEVLAAAPGFFDAGLLLGHLYLHSGRARQAAETTRRAIAVHAGHPVAHFNLGLALLELGQNEDAERSFGRAAALKPDYAEAYCNRGIALQNQGKFDAAMPCFEEAIRHDPANLAAFSNLGISLQKTGRHEEAIDCFGKAQALNPGSAPVFNNRGISLLALRRIDGALDDFDRALVLDPDYAEALSNHGLALQYADRDEEALASFDRALQLDPESAQTHSHRGMSLLKLGRAEEAMLSLDRALGAAPDSAEVLNNRGLALQYVGRSEEALRCFDQALSERPAQAETLNNLGNVLRDMNRGVEALARYEDALVKGGDDATTHLNAALCRLLQGDYLRGWEEFEWRWQTPQYRVAHRAAAAPLWLGREGLEGKRILLHAEQGLGDTLQFCRYVPLVAEKGATVVLEVQPALKGLMAGLADVSQVLTPDDPSPECDFHCPLMSLPLAFRTEAGSIPAPRRYLFADRERVFAWGAKLTPRKRLRIGLAWSGNAAFANDRHRSIPWPVFSGLLSECADFVSLQKELRSSESALVQHCAGLTHFGGQLQDFSDTAALVENVDLVIAVDTAIAHLAGALGKPVWILLPFNGDWRWQLEREDSPWYPTARLFRQTRLGDWETVIHRVAEELSVFLRAVAV